VRRRPSFRHTIAALAAGTLLAAGPSVVGAQQSARDSLRARRDSIARADSLRADSTFKKVFGEGSDFGFQVNARLEAKNERISLEPCTASIYSLSRPQCDSRAITNLDFQTAMKAGGTIQDRIRTDIDYDSRREFDGSSRFSLSYMGKENEWLRRVEVGNVDFDVPASRFITSGIPRGNYGIQAAAQFGGLGMRAIFAQQKGIVQHDRVFTIGGSGAQSGSLEIDDYQVEQRRFFFTVDPRRFAGYPNVDILDRVRLGQLAAALPDSVRPVRVSLYRQLIGGQPPNPNGPQFRIIGDPNSRPGPVYEPLRENVDFYVDPSQLWVVLAQALDPNKERLVLAYSVRVAGRDTVIATSGGTPDIARVAGRDQLAHLLWDPNVRPGDDAFYREIRAGYRIGGEEVRRESVQLRVVTGGTFDQERPVSGSRSYLEFFRISKLGIPTDFDAENRVWPRRGDPILALAGSASPSVIRERFVIFPSLQPFARAGLVTDAANPANDAIYVTPSEDLYSALHPQPVYKLRLSFEADGGGDATSFDLGATQLRPKSERIALDDGTILRRDLDYIVDYDLGRVTILRADSVYARPRRVTVRFEETPLFLATPTQIFGLASSYAIPNGELSFIAIGQKQHSTFTKPQLGYADESAVVAGASATWGLDIPAFARAARRLTGKEPASPSRLRFNAEIARSQPLTAGSGEAYIETFDGDAAFTISLDDPNWAYSSQPSIGRALAQRAGGAANFDTSRAVTMAWQTHGLARNDSVPIFTLAEIDPLTNFAGNGFLGEERALWMTLYPRGIGGAYDDKTKKYRWMTGATATPGPRYRSIRQPLGGGAGVNLTGKEAVEFWALVDTTAANRAKNPTIVVDLGDVSENAISIVPQNLTVLQTGSGRDSSWTGRAIVGLDTLHSERDPFSRAFNSEKNDIGLPGDLVPRLLVSAPEGGGIQTNVPMCSRTTQTLARLGDTRPNCTVGNGKLDEEDLDGDNVLNLLSAQREQERVFRYIADLAVPTTWSRVGGCRPDPNDALGPAAPALCWVLVRLPFSAPNDTINGGPSVQRVRSARLTMISGPALDGDQNAFSRVAITRFRLVGANWLKRSDRTIRGIGGDRAGNGRVFAGVIGTQDSLSALGYQSPPGVVDESERQLTGLENQRVVINERSLRLTATSLAPLERAEAVFRFPEGARNFRQYREMRLWAKGRGSGWGQNGQLQFFVKIGRDPNSFYALRVPAYAGPGQNTWLPEVRVDFEKLYALRAQLENAWLQNSPDSISCSGADRALIAGSVGSNTSLSRRYAACSNGYIVYAADPVVSPPNLTAVQEISVGMVRVDSVGGSSPIIPGDTLELWIDDIRLGDVVSTAGYAGEISATANLGDVAQVRAGFTRRDANFRQLGEAPSYVGDNLFELSATVRLDQFLGGAGGWALPVTAIMRRGTSNPEYLTRSDVRAANISGIRTPIERTSEVSVSLRRVTPVAGGWLAPFVNHLSATAGLGSADRRSEFQVAEQGRVNAGVDYSIGGDSPAGTMPGWWTSMFDALPGWIGGAELVQTLRNAKPRLQPAAFRTSGNYLSQEDIRENFLAAASSVRDTSKRVDGRINAWRNATTLELKPFESLTARYEVSSTRDLVNYGDSTATAVAAAAERERVFGFDAGLESERALTTSYTLAPQMQGWVRPRFELMTSYGHLRDPNARLLLREGDTTGAFRLPRRVNAAQTMNGVLTFDLARLSRAWTRDSASIARVDRMLLPLEASALRIISANYDGTPRTPGLGMQFGFGGEGTFLSDQGVLASTATSTTQVALGSGLRLPLGLTLEARTQRMAARNWMRRPDKSQVIVDGDLITLPDVGLRSTLRPSWLSGVLTSITASARYVATAQHSRLPGLAGTGPDARIGRSMSYPLSASLTWNDEGGLTTSFSFATTHRTDSMPGTVTEALTRDVSGEMRRSFKLPAEWELRSDLRTRLAWQRTSATTWVETSGGAAFRSRLADNGREALSFNADTDVSANATFSLQSARIITFDNNLNRRLTQVVFSAVLQISFFGGQLR
jgi:cell surface protein SprA